MSAGSSLSCCMVGLIATAAHSTQCCVPAWQVTVACQHVGLQEHVQIMVSPKWLRQACLLVAAPDCLPRGASWMRVCPLDL